MELKRRKSKVSYTVMVTSDSAKKSMREFHLRAGAVGAVTLLVFLLVVFVICYMVYSSIALSDSVERSKGQQEQITRLQEEKSQLELKNQELADKVSILSETVNQKVEVEQALAAEKEEIHIPKGFPLSGSAQIETAEEAAANAEAQGTEEDEAALPEDTVEEEIDRNEIVFAASEGINVIAAGAGTVTVVDADVKYGNTISIDHGNGYVTTYRNAGSPVVKSGDEVTRGAILYVVGEDNKRMGYSITKEGTYIDPMEIIEING